MKTIHLFLIALLFDIGFYFAWLNAGSLNLFYFIMLILSSITTVIIFKQYKREKIIPLQQEKNYIG